MLNDGQTLVIRSLIDYINKNYKFNDKFKVTFDSLQTNRDSVCLTTTVDSTPVEKPADVTGDYLSGTLRLAIIYRLMQVPNESKDLEAINAVDDLYRFIKSKYKEIKGETFFIDKVSQISGAKLDTVYAGGIKDYRGILELNYERQVI